MIVKIVLHSPKGTARLNYDEEGHLIEGDRDRAIEIGKTATQMEVVADTEYVILTHKNTVLAGDHEALLKKLDGFPDDEIQELFNLMVENHTAIPEVAPAASADTASIDTVSLKPAAPQPLQPPSEPNDPPADVFSESDVSDLLADDSDHEDLLS